MSVASIPFASLPWFFPRGVDLVNNLPLIILTLWVALIFSTLVYFHGCAKDLEQKPGTITPIQRSVGAISIGIDVTMLVLAFYLVLR
jgi:hypothetical protein